MRWRPLAGSPAIVAAFAAQLAIGIPFGLPSFFVAVLDVGLRIVFPHPGDDVFCVQGDTGPKVGCDLCQFGLILLHSVPQQKLEGLIGKLA